MEWVFQWVKNITYYLVFISLISGLMPDTRYERYVKLFYGIVFILLVVSPLTAGLKLDKMLAQAYEALCMEGDTGSSEFADRLQKIEAEQVERVFAQYEKAVAQDIQVMAEEAGFSCRQVSVRIEGREGEACFGQVAAVELVLGPGGPAGPAVTAPAAAAPTAVAPAAAAPTAAAPAAVAPTAAAPAAVAPTAADPPAAAPAATDPPAAAQTVADPTDTEAAVGVNGWEVAPINIKVGLEDEGGGTGSRTVFHGSKQKGDMGQKGDKEQEGHSEQEALYGFQRKVAGYYGLDEKAVRITWKDD